MSGLEKPFASPGPESGAPPLPMESGRPRVQRLVSELFPVHIELDPPECPEWTVRVNGLVDEETEFTLDELLALGVEEFVADFHCVWGWSKPRMRWAGVPTGRVLDAVGLDPASTHVRFQSLDSPYAACVTLQQARDGIFATEMDGRPLQPIHGGPLRWLQPPYLWGYKGVKWVSGLTVLDELVAGPWEQKVGDVPGIVPPGIVALFDELEEEVESDVTG